MRKAIISGLVCLALLISLVFAGYCIGYQDAVQNATLTLCTEYGYEIQYNGDAHWYTFE